MSKSYDMGLSLWDLKKRTLKTIFPYSSSFHKWWFQSHVEFIPARFLSFPSHVLHILIVVRACCFPIGLQIYLLEQRAVIDVEGGKFLNEDHDRRSVSLLKLSITKIWSFISSSLVQVMPFYLVEYISGSSLLGNGAM